MGDLAKMMSDLHYLYTYIIYIADMLYRRITLLYPESALAYQFLTSDVFFTWSILLVIFYERKDTLISVLQATNHFDCAENDFTRLAVMFSRLV